MAMAIVHSGEEWAARFGPAQKSAGVTVGNFDGVHLGHQKILRRVRDRAARENLLAGVLTFHPHPARVLRPQEAPSLLATLEQRLAAFEAAGMDAVLVQRFDKAFARVSAEEFVRRLLVEAMRARVVLVGGNFRFGHRQGGDVKRLEELGRNGGFEVEVVAPVVVDGIVVSSSAIRECVREGRMEDAGRLLGRPFSLAGEIRPGTGAGRRLVVPTLNLVTEQELLPMRGVYATETIVEGKLYRSATNVGVRPTFDGGRFAIESHLFEFSENLTQGPMEIRFWTRLREERKFPSPDALREQVLRDLARARGFFRQLDSHPNVRASDSSLRR